MINVYNESKVTQVNRYTKYNLVIKKVVFGISFNSGTVNLHPNSNNTPIKEVIIKILYILFSFDLYLLFEKYINIKSIIYTSALNIKNLPVFIFYSPFFNILVFVLLDTCSFAICSSAIILRCS